jgi:ubiquinone/menaquinone biosynthesis C-methylase UbiE
MTKKSFSQLQREYYDLHAKKYDRRRFYSRENRNHFKKISRIIKILKTNKPRQVLEVGAGSGIHANWLLRNSGSELQFTGVDISFQMLAVARGRVNKYMRKRRARLITADALSLPFQDSSFDLVFCAATLHHVLKPQQAIVEMVRVLKREGRLILMEPQPLFPTNLFAALTNPLEKNVFKMSKRNFSSWTNDLLRDVYIDNFLYTPPYPKSLGAVYDRVDSLLSKIPVIRSLSIMIFVSGKKK